MIIAHLQRFITEILRLPDVWFVTNSQAIQWMKQPTTLADIQSFEPWNCKKQFDQSEVACTQPNICRLHSRVLQQDRFLYTCNECPKQYPWIRNEFGIN